MLSVIYMSGFVVRRKRFTDLIRGLKIIKDWIGEGRGKSRKHWLLVSCFVLQLFLCKKKHKMANPYTWYQIKYHIFHKLNRHLGKQPMREFSTCAAFAASFKPTVKQQGHICTLLPFLLYSYDTLSFLEWYSYFISSPNFGSLFITCSFFFFFFLSCVSWFSKERDQSS